ncbi:MAG: hypothetical protein ABIJ82_00280 [Patescibacteria group bacterium]|nr:hypothetical protein [Patescibacteria group bacterium]MBU1953247.1 hypothetical protein [Patescibacteria group bacterium]
MKITDLDEVQQFRVKLSAYLKNWVVPSLKAGKDATIRMDGNVFDALSTGPHLAANWENVIMAIGEYSRAILFYEFNIRTYPRRFPRDLYVEFPAVEPADTPEMPKWDPIPQVEMF